jgi:excinuclease UvrABC nuclease subunit
MKKSRFKAPYNKLGKTTFRFTSKKSGVYLIKSKRTNKIVYVGYSGSDLYRTMYRHFQKWTDNTQYRATFTKNSHTVRVVLTTPKRATLLERALIIKYKPIGNAKQLKSLKGQTKKSVMFPTSKPERQILKEYETDTDFLTPREDTPF